MTCLAIIGTETSFGAALQDRLERDAPRSETTPNVVGIPTRAADQAEALFRTASDVIVCSEAAASSWTASKTPRAVDSTLLTLWRRLAAAAGTRLVYLSGDELFRGPWMFHEEDSTRYASGRPADDLLAAEQAVLADSRNLVIRTHLVDGAPGSLADRLRQAADSGTALSVSSGRYATPISVGRFARMLKQILATSISGILHLGGAERVSPWELVTRLARQQNLTAVRIVPETHPSPQERSLRCTRLRHELGLYPVPLKDTLKDLSGMPGERLPGERLLRAA